MTDFGGIEPNVECRSAHHGRRGLGRAHNLCVIVWYLPITGKSSQSPAFSLAYLPGRDERRRDMAWMESY